MSSGLKLPEQTPELFLPYFLDKVYLGDLVSGALDYPSRINQLRDLEIKKASSFQNWPLKLAPQAGLEPATKRLTVACSTN